MFNPWDIAERLRGARRREGLTQEELANRVGTKRLTIWRIENGQAGHVALGTVAAALYEVGLQLECTPVLHYPAQMGPPAPSAIFDYVNKKYYGGRLEHV